MIHVQRDGSGDIVALVQRPLTDAEQAAGHWHPMPPDDPAVVAFAARLVPQADNPLAQTDTALARVLEDLIEVLIDRSLIQFTDLPAPAQGKLLERRQTRARLANRLDLLDDGEIL